MQTACSLTKSRRLLAERGHVERTICLSETRDYSTTLPSLVEGTSLFVRIRRCGTKSPPSGAFWGFLGPCHCIKGSQTPFCRPNTGKKGKRRLCLPQRHPKPALGFLETAPLGTANLFAGKNGVFHGLTHAKLQSRFCGNLNCRSRRGVSAFAGFPL